MSAPKIAILGSGRGTNFEAIAARVADGQLQASIEAVISDQPAAGILEKALARGLTALPIPPFSGKREQESEILAVLRSRSVEWVVLAGYMRILSPEFIQNFRSKRGYSRVINIHPSLLPAFPGLSGYEQAFQHGVKVCGVTIHLVESGVDSGPICAQQAFDITGCKSAREVEERGLKVEHELYPRTLAWVLPERFEFESSESGEGRARVRPN